MREGEKGAGRKIFAQIEKKFWSSLSLVAVLLADASGFGSPMKHNPHSNMSYPSNSR